MVLLAVYWNGVRVIHCSEVPLTNVSSHSQAAQSAPHYVTMNLVGGGNPHDQLLAGLSCSSVARQLFGNKGNYI